MTIFLATWDSYLPRKCQGSKVYMLEVGDNFIKADPGTVLYRKVQDCLKMAALV